MRVRIDEAWRNDESSDLDRSRRAEVGGGGVANEDDPVAANADVGYARRSSCAIDDCAAMEQEVHGLGAGGAHRQQQYGDDQQETHRLEDCWM
jgi:hypothetical protein